MGNHCNEYQDETIIGKQKHINYLKLCDHSDMQCASSMQIKLIFGNPGEVTSSRKCRLHNLSGDRKRRFNFPEHVLSMIC